MHLRKQLTEKALNRIRDSRSLPGLIQEALGVSRVTMWKYLKGNTEELTKAASLEVIMRETELGFDEIVENAEAVTAH